MKTTHIATEILDFLAHSEVTSAQLAREAGISPVYISRLKNGRRKDIRSEYADKIRAAMKRFLSPGTPDSSDAA